LVFLRILAIALFWTIGYYFLAKGYFAFGLFIISWGMEQIGWLHHEGGHRSLTGNVTIDALIQDFCVYILYGGSSNFWNYQHNSHHANTQHEEYDIDLKTLPLIAFDNAILNDGPESAEEKAKEFQKRKSKSFWIKHQWFTFLFSNLMVYYLWRFFVHTRYELRKKHYSYLVVSYGICYVWHFGILMYFCDLNFLWSTAAYLLYSMFGMWLLLFHFTVSHTFTGTQTGRYNWVETAARHTVNVRDHWLVNIIMGLLNFQIEHHLFPQMSHRNARRAAPYVKSLFKKYQLPYYEYGYFEGFWLVFVNLYHVGHDLPDIRPSVALAEKLKGE